MTFKEMYNAFDKIIRDVKSDRMGNTMIQIGADALAMIRRRVTETGVDAEGKKFAPYSQTPMLVGCKSMNSNVCKSFFGKQKNKEHKWVTLDRTNNQGKKIRLAVLEGGYKQLRGMHGRQTGHVDFMFSGRMWLDIKIISSNTQHNNGVVVLGASTDENKKVLAGNTERKGQILALNNEEVRLLTNIYKKKIKQFFREAV